MKRWIPPRGWTAITTVDAHTAGEPLRVFVDGIPKLPPGNILQQRRFLKENADYFRTALMWEPRGHREMYGCVMVPPTNRKSDFGVIFLHNEGYSTMCGHGIIGVTTVALETGLFRITSPEVKLRIDTPAGVVTSRAIVENNHVQSVAFQNVPSFAYALNREIVIPGHGRILYDVAFGGAYYAYVRADQFGFRCVPEEQTSLVSMGMVIKRAIMKSVSINHPGDPELGFLYGTIFHIPSSSEGVLSRNVCIFAEGQVDRSPTGTGVSGRLALLHARGEIALRQSVVIESIIGTRFTGMVVDTSSVGSFNAIVPEVTGSASITGRHVFLIDPSDPLKNGFIL